MYNTLILIFLLFATPALADTVEITITQDTSGYHVHDAVSANSIDFNDINEINDFISKSTSQMTDIERKFRAILETITNNDPVLENTYDHAQYTYGEQVVPVSAGTNSTVSGSNPCS